MKNLFKIALLTFLTILAISCKSDDDDVVVSEEFMTALIDGQQFTANGDQFVPGFFASFSSNGGLNELEISGYENNPSEPSTEIKIRMTGFNGNGTYSKGNSDIECIVEKNAFPIADSNHEGDTVNLNVTESEGDFFEGTFSFKATRVLGEEMVVTNGVFKIEKF